MTANKVILTIASVIIILGASGCAPPPPPPHDARAINESEMEGDLRTVPSPPPAGGGTVLRESQW